jgi:hypothetical protein
LFPGEGPFRRAAGVEQVKIHGEFREELLDIRKTRVAVGGKGWLMEFNEFAELLARRLVESIPDIDQQALG